MNKVRNSDWVRIESLTQSLFFFRVCLLINENRGLEVDTDKYK